MGARPLVACAAGARVARFYIRKCLFALCTQTAGCLYGVCTHTALRMCLARDAADAQRDRGTIWRCWSHTEIFVDTRMAVRRTRQSHAADPRHGSGAPERVGRLWRQFAIQQTRSCCAKQLVAALVAWRCSARGECAFAWRRCD